MNYMFDFYFHIPAGKNWQLPERDEMSPSQTRAHTAFHRLTFHANPLIEKIMVHQKAQNLIFMQRKDMFWQGMLKSSYRAENFTLQKCTEKWGKG